MKPLTIDQIAEAAGGSVLHREAWKQQALAGAVIDSRLVAEGMLFVPVKGEHTDGHFYIEQAFSQGAALVLTEDPSLVPKDRPAILVGDTKKALWELAGAYKRTFSIPFIAVTGSVGKTSTKEMTASILGTTMQVHKTKGNFNNDLGVPLTLLGLEACHEAAVIEMGMDRFGEIRALSRLVEPDIGIITNIGFSHIEHLGSQEGILKAKAELLDHLKPEGTLVICGDDPLLRTLIGKYPQRILTYGFREDCDCRLQSVRPLEDGGQEVGFTLFGEACSTRVPYAGEHLMLNAMAGALAGKLAGLDTEAVIEGIRRYANEKGRLQVTRLAHGAFVIDDTYNATVDSMKSALRTLVQLRRKDQRAVAVLGDMLEMGTYSRQGHRDVGAFAAGAGIDLLVAVGREAAAIREGWMAESPSEGAVCLHFETQEAWLDKAPELLDGSEAVVVKGSRGMHMERTVEWIIEGERER